MRACPHPRAVQVAALALLAVLAPLALSALDPAVLSHSYGRSSARFELIQLPARLVRRAGRPELGFAVAPATQARIESSLQRIQRLAA